VRRDEPSGAFPEPKLLHAAKRVSPEIAMLPEAATALEAAITQQNSGLPRSAPPSIVARDSDHGC
jgi:hypothetical protein